MPQNGIHTNTLKYMHTLSSICKYFRYAVVSSNACEYFGVFACTSECLCILHSTCSIQNGQCPRVHEFSLEYMQVLPTVCRYSSISQVCSYTVDYVLVFWSIVYILEYIKILQSTKNTQSGAPQVFVSTPDHLYVLNSGVHTCTYSGVCVPYK
jgi:hypothetical protein